MRAGSARQCKNRRAVGVEREGRQRERRGREMGGREREKQLKKRTPMGMSPEERSVSIVSRAACRRLRAVEKWPAGRSTAVATSATKAFTPERGSHS